MMDNPNIGNSNEEINILGEIEVGLVEDANANFEEVLEMDYDQHSKAIVKVCKDKDIEETENGPGNSLMDEEKLVLDRKFQRNWWIFMVWGRLKLIRLQVRSN